MLSKQLILFGIELFSHVGWDNLTTIIMPFWDIEQQQ